jgi:hypothetical protein
LRQAFGERGGGFGALMNLPQFIEQFATLQQRMKSFQGGGDVLDYLSKNSPVQQANLTWAQAQNVLMDIGQIALPPVVSGLQELDALLKELGATVKLISGPLTAIWNAIPSPLRSTSTLWGNFNNALGDLGAALGITPAQAAAAGVTSPYANGGGPGDVFKGAASLASPVPVTVVAPTPGVHPGRDVHSPQTGPLAYTPAAAPAPVNTTANVKVDVFVDAELVASKIASAFESAFRLPSSSAGADGGANHMPPDSYNF